jgi:transcriptional regulator with PAS, ATPase and Fis domain
MATHSTQTTMPSQRTASGLSGRTVLAIRWGFPTSGGTLSLLTDERVLLGRDEDCQVKLPGKETSRHHAEIHRKDPLHVVKDLDSRNGVFLDGVRIQEAPISADQVLRLGEWIGIVVNASPDVPEPEPAFDLLVTNLAGGPVLRPILEQARLAASSSLPTVICGETGTGKEGVSRAMHAWSGRKGPFVAVNCATLVPTLAEAELFGYRKGAFTGADRPSSGHFRAAQGGTLLLDEVADLPETVQAKLLRALEQREILPIGESVPVPIDVRVLAATQTPLAQLVAERRFRADLCARLDGLTIRLPPLRERKLEIPYLFSYLLQIHSGGRPPEVEPRLVEQLCLYDWPFNVRELDLLVRRLLVLHGHEPVLRRSFLPEHILDRRAAAAKTSGVSFATPSIGTMQPAPNTPESHRVRRERELAQLTEALRAHNGSVARAAVSVGISRQRAYRLMEAGGGAGAVESDEQDQGEAQ